MKSLPPLPGARRRRTSSKSLFGALTLALCAGSMPIHAADVYEGFDYAPGTNLNSANAAIADYYTNAPNGQNGGTGWFAGWGAGAGTAGARNTVAGSLSYTGITSAGNKLEIEGSRIFRRLATDLTEGNTYYVSVLMQKDSANTGYMGLMLANAASNQEKLLIGTSGTYSNWMLGGNFDAQAGVAVPVGHALHNATHVNYLSSTAPNSNLALLLVKLEMRPVAEDNPTGAEQITFWVNPDLSQPEDVTTAVGGQSFPSYSDYGAIRWVRAGGGANTKHYMDEIRISQSTPFTSISVEQPEGTALKNGESSSAFGALPSSQPHTLTYTLRNTGTDDLTGLTVAVGGADAASFVAGTLSTTTLTPDDFTTFDVTFTPSALGNYEAELTIGSDDPINDSFIVALVGQVILPRPDVAAGAKPNALKGVRSYAPTKQLADLKSSKARRVTGHIGVGNNAILPDGRAADRISVRGKKGNALFKVRYNGPGGNVTTAVVAAGHQTTAIDGNSGMTKLQAVVTPNKKKLAKRKGKRTVYAKKTFSTLIRATSLAYPSASDSATIRVRTR